jgi:hypothetical protein
LREAGSLRGAPAEREPRSVHVVYGSFLSRGREHRRQRMSGGRRGGERRRLATFQGASTGRKGKFKHATCDPAKTRPSLGPLNSCALIATTHRRRKSFGGGAVAAVSRSGKPTQVGGTGNGVVTIERSTTRRTEPLPQGRGRFRVRTGRWSWPSSQRGTRARVRARTSKSRSLQKSVGGIRSRISSAYALQKGRTGSSERGPSRGECRR